MIDLLTGQHLLKDALISNYYLPGFRYYGIGNDYLGIILGLSLAGVFSYLDDREEAAAPCETAVAQANKIIEDDNTPPDAPFKIENPPLASHDLSATATPPKIKNQKSKIKNPLFLLLWIGIAFVLGWPAFGANAGSVIVTTVGFGVGWRLLRGPGAWRFAPRFCASGPAFLVWRRLSRHPFQRFSQYPMLAQP